MIKEDNLDYVIEVGNLNYVIKVLYTIIISTIIKLVTLKLFVI